MSAYFLVEVDVTNPDVYDGYRKLVGPTLDKYGGKFLVRGGSYQTIEGDWPPQRVVILEFENTEQFQRWYDSPEYTAAREIRLSASTARAILIQGV